MIVSQVTPLLTGETAGGIGRYTLNIGEQSIASNATFGGTYGVLTLGAGCDATFPIIGGLLAGTNVTYSPYVTQLISGSPGSSGAKFAVSVSETANAATMTCTSNVATKWLAMSSGANGELVKISSWLLG